MDMLKKLNTGAQVILGAGVLFLIFSFFNWYEVKHTSLGESMWHGVGFIAGLLLIVILAIVIVGGAWLNMQAAGESLADVKAKISSMTSSSGSGGASAADTSAAPAAPAPAPTPAPPPPAPEPPAAEPTSGDDEPAA